jgi:hypothetical protein
LYRRTYIGEVVAGRASGNGKVAFLGEGFLVTDVVLPKLRSCARVVL